MNDSRTQADDERAERVRSRSSWIPALASIGFSLASLYFAFLYSFLHTPVLMRHYSALSATPELRSLLLTLLNRMEAYRLLALAGLIFMFWAARGQPKWPVGIALLIGGIAAVQAVVIQ